MKDCCKTGDEQEPTKNNWSKWLRYTVISVVVMAILFVLFNQINS